KRWARHPRSVWECMSVHFRGNLNYDWSLRFCRFPVGRDPRSHFRSMTPDAVRLLTNNPAVRVLFKSKALWKQENRFMGRDEDSGTRSHIQHCSFGDELSFARDPHDHWTCRWDMTEILFDT